ncbi:TetR family transcriptional regulator, partial [Nonomuraea sp. K274]|nr:TetR family transcriptional regulator [Nonomuraea cypriaca]
GEGPLDALRRHFLDGLARRDPVTGLNDHPEVVAFHRMVFGTPSLTARVFQYMSRDEQALAEALGEGMDELTAGLLAAQVLAAQRVLARRNWVLLAEGRSAREVEAEAVRAAERAFALLAAAGESREPAG